MKGVYGTMKKEVYYRYLGTNGVLDTPIHIEDAYYVRMLMIQAEPRHYLTDGVQKTNSILIPETDEDKWQEISLDA